MKSKTIILVAFCAFLTIMSACSFTTAKLAKIDFGKNEKATPSTTTFDVGDKVFIVSEVTGALGKHKMKFDIAFEAPAGQKVTSPPFSKEVDFDGSVSPYFMLPVTQPGTYKVDVTLSDEGGKQIDKKSGSFTVKGAPAATPDASVKSDADGTKDADTDKDSDEKKEDK